MADQTWMETAKTVGEWVAGLGLSSAAVRAYRKASNANHLERIIRVENQNKELRRVMNEAVEQLQELASTVDIDRGDTHRRFQRVEADLRETKRIYREKLLQIADALVEPLQQSAAAGKQPEPRAES